jgi:hypothetical protein
MTRDDFMAQAVASDKPRDEIKRIYDSIEAAGEFDNVPHETSTPQEPEEATFIERAGRRIGEFPQRFEEAKETSGGGLLGPVNAAVGETVRTIGDVAGEAGKSATAILPRPVREFAGRQVGKLVSSAAETPGIKQGLGAFQKLPESTRYNLGTSAGVAGLLPLTGPTIKSVGEAVKLGKEIKIGIGEGLEKGAARIQGTKVKINSPEFRKGAQNEMYTKHEVFGNAGQVRDQWQEKIKDTYNQVRERIQNVPDSPENYASVDDIFKAAEKAAETYGKSPTGTAAIKKSLASLRKEFDAAYPDGKINLLDAQAEKQVIGKKGDWLARSGEISGNPEAAISSQAHNTLYDALKVNVENKGAPGIRELNKQLSEMIPMERAASKQMLVENRKNLIPLDAFIGGIHSTTAAAGGNVLPALMTLGTLGTRSPLLAKGMYKIGKAIKGDKKLLGNRSGAVGSADEFAGLQSKAEGLTPALKDPVTGKVYSDQLGHKYILNKIVSKENPQAEKALWNELFKDNTGKYSQSVGFIDKEGKFISRQEAESALSSPKSILQQYHEGSGAVPMLGATTALSGGTLLGGLALQRKHNKKK